MGSSEFMVNSLYCSNGTLQLLIWHVGTINPYPTSVKLFFVATVRSSPRDGPLNRWACLTTRLFESLGVFNDALDNTRL